MSWYKRKFLIKKKHEKKIKTAIIAEKRRSNAALLYVLSYIFKINIFKDK
jgi:hypothetical protein